MSLILCLHVGADAADAAAVGASEKTLTTCEIECQRAEMGSASAEPEIQCCLGCAPRLIAAFACAEKVSLEGSSALKNH